MTLDGSSAGFEFPCDYEIKAMGHNDGNFHEVVLRIVNRHCREQPAEAASLQQRVSRTGKYVSVSVVIRARDMAHLDAIYEELSAHEQVLARL